MKRLIVSDKKQGKPLFYLDDWKEIAGARERYALIAYLVDEIVNGDKNLYKKIIPLDGSIGIVEGIYNPSTDHWEIIANRVRLGRKISVNLEAKPSLLSINSNGYKVEEY